MSPPGKSSAAEPRNGANPETPLPSTGPPPSSGARDPAPLPDGAVDAAVALLRQPSSAVHDSLPLPQRVGRLPYPRTARCRPTSKLAAWTGGGQ